MSKPMLLAWSTFQQVAHFRVSHHIQFYHHKTSSSLAGPDPRFLRSRLKSFLQFCSLQQSEVSHHHPGVHFWPCSGRGGSSIEAQEEQRRPQQLMVKTHDQHQQAGRGKGPLTPAELPSVSICPFPLFSLVAWPMACSRCWLPLSLCIGSFTKKTACLSLCCFPQTRMQGINWVWGIEEPRNREGVITLQETHWWPSERWLGLVSTNTRWAGVLVRFVCVGFVVLICVCVRVYCMSCVQVPAEVREEGTGPTELE